MNETYNSFFTHTYNLLEFFQENLIKERLNKLETSYQIVASAQIRLHIQGAEIESIALSKCAL